MTRADFLLERQTGIGSSDAASLMNVGYGCKRRLWYDKVGVPADYLFDGNALTRLGHALEPLFREFYQEKTGRKVEHVDIQRHPKHPFLFTHLDGVITSEPTFGVLEVKSLGRGMFYQIKREGMPQDYILQVQWSMMVTGLTWGSFAPGNRDNGDIIPFDFVANKELGEMLEAAGIEFWETVKESKLLADPAYGEYPEVYAPDRLPPDDSRCARCEWRNKCQGAALNAISNADDGRFVERNDLLPLYVEYRERESLLHQAEDLVEETKQQLKAEIGATPRVKVNGKAIHYAPQDNWRYSAEELADYVERLRQRLMWAENRFDEEFKRDWPAAAKRCSKSRPFRIY